MDPEKIKKMLKWLLPLLLVLFIAQEMLRHYEQERHREPRATPRAVTPAPTDLGADERNNIDIFEQTSPSVVFINNAALRRDFFSLNIYEIPQGAGSGFVWDDQGHIITNYHVIHRADKIEVTFGDMSYQARVIGSAPDYDLAVLRIDAPSEALNPIPIGTSSDLRVGQKVLAIGNPFGLDRSLSTGVISALGRSIQSITRHEIQDVIQTDTAINPGNSGGPLLDSYGRLIGVATAIYSPSGANAGVGFAVPVDTVNRIIPQLIEKGKIVRAGLGVSLIPDHYREKELGLQGAMIYQMLPSSAAKEAGLQGTYRNREGRLILGDRIIRADHQNINTNDDLISYFEQNKSVGDTVELEFIRDEQSHTVRAMLQAL